MKKRAPLMVVATLDPKSVGKQTLAQYSTEDGDFITSAGLKFVFSPFTGKEVKASLGKVVATTINEAKAFGVICQSCKSINATTSQTRSEMFCVTCGTHMKYDVASEGLDDEEVDEILEEASDSTEEEITDEDMIGGDIPEVDGEETSEEELVLMDDDMSDEESEDAACSKGKGKTKAEVVDKTESEDEDTDEDDVQNAGPLDEFMLENTEEADGDSVVDMTELVDEDDEVDIVDVESKVIAMVSGYVVATMPSTHDNAERVLSSAFKNGFRHTIATQGLRKALVSAGFKPKRILVSDVVAAAAKRATKDVERKVVAAQAKNTRRFADCLDIATAGGMVGMFSKEKAGLLVDELANVLATLNIVSPKRVARNVLAKALAQHNKAIVNVATDLMGREDAVLSTYREQIASLGGKAIFAEAEELDETEDLNVDEEDTVESRLNTPMRKSTRVKAATVATVQPTLKSGLQVAGLFSK